MLPSVPMYNGFAEPDHQAYIAVLIVLLGILAVLLIFSLISYLFGSIGLATMAKYRGIRKYALAWLPIGNAWILGSISDQYRHVVKGQIYSRRKTLLGLNIAICVISVLVDAVTFLLPEEGFVILPPVWTPILYVALLLLACAMLVLSVILTVHTYIAYCDVFLSADPDTGVTKLVLGILFPFLLPFFVFAARKKDYGMPPRRPV